MEFLNHGRLPDLGLCAFMGRLGAFGEPFDLIVSGISRSERWEVGVSLGTIGACLTARNGPKWVAVSQAVWAGVEDAWDDIVLNQIWETLQPLHNTSSETLDDGLPEKPIIANINVPNVELADLKGWKRTTIIIARFEACRPPHETDWRSGRHLRS